MLRGGGINAFDITNLDLYYGIKPSHRKNVSNIHIELKTNGYPKSADFLLCPHLQERKKPSNIISAAEYLRLKRHKEQNTSAGLPCLSNNKKHNRKLSKLAAASLAVVLSVFISPVTAQETAPPVPVPTLDKLHQEGVINPATEEKDQDPFRKI